MTNIREIIKKEHEIVQAMLDVMEVHKTTESRCDLCMETKKERTWYSFKLDAIRDKNEYYEKLSDILRESGGNEDWNYKMMFYILEGIKELQENDPEKTIENFQNGDEFHEMVDSLVDIYNWDLLQWFSGSFDNTEFFMDALQEHGTPDSGERLLMIAQYRAIYEITHDIAYAITQ